METRDQTSDHGSVMPMTAILVVFLMVGSWALVSASQQWAARREAQAVAAAAARAGAQGDTYQLRGGGVLDPDLAAQRARAVIVSAGYGGSVLVDGEAVTVSVVVAVDYAFPSAGFPDTIRGTSTAVALRGITEPEGQ